ncbi:amino acid permease-associated region [Alkaliphilus metalliredigens QYMF]|uniref:Amino acid permease-associated region n=1 Tax=Alkaliphilus metalliredigens (strain QYMF) TaxID=293826 RepID=A6TL55_ALKMQ|nr:APC family permease [Alkaliphilus metalliredigens]ABR46923.1 amino acid permease-associated region [Alkaliphilus metalliredigens QYMF]
MGQQDFSKSLSKKDVIALAFGAMIGWGWVVLAGQWIQAAGSLGAMLAFMLGGVMVVFVGLVYSELTCAMPQVGGEHVFAFRGIGTGASFIATWAIILGYVSVVAFEAVALPTVIEYLVPNYKMGYLWTISGYDVYLTWVLVGMMGTIFVGYINYLGVQPVAFMQSVFTALIAIVGILFMGGALFNGSTELMDPLFIDGSKGIFAVLVMTPLMFVGFNVIPQAVEEINLPYNEIGKVLILSVVMAVAWYVLIIWGVGRSLTPAQMANSTLSTADAMTAVFRTDWGGKILVLGGIGGILTSWNAFYVGGSRAIYAMAKSKMLPGFLGQLHPKYKTPTNAIILIGIVSCFAPLLGRPMLVWLVDAGGLAIVVAYLLVSIAFVSLRKNEPDMPRPFKVNSGMFVGYTSIVLSIGFLILFLPGMPAALVWPYEWIMVGGWAALGAIFYYKAKKDYGQDAAHKYMTNSLDTLIGKKGESKI